MISSAEIYWPYTEVARNIIQIMFYFNPLSKFGEENIHQNLAYVQVEVELRKETLLRKI